MAKLDEVLKLVRLYEEKYRHPSLTRFSVSNKYDLFPGKENMENCWPQCYPYADRPGVYLIMDDKDNVLYIGKSSVAIGRKAQFVEYQPEGLEVIFVMMVKGNAGLEALIGARHLNILQLLRFHLIRLLNVPL